MDYKDIVEKRKDHSKDLVGLFADLNYHNIIISQLSDTHQEDFRNCVASYFNIKQQRAIIHLLHFFEDIYQKNVNLIVDNPIPPLQPIADQEQKELDEYAKNVRYIEDVEFIKSLGEFEGNVNE